VAASPARARSAAIITLRPWVAVGEHTGDRAEQQHRQHLEGDDGGDTEPGGRQVEDDDHQSDGVEGVTGTRHGVGREQPAQFSVAAQQRKHANESCSAGQPLGTRP